MAARITIYAFFLLVCCILKANQAASHVNISTDESALLSFKAQITSDPNGILAKNWTKGTTVCSWIGISCSQRHQRVTTLVLKSLQLSGTIAKEMGSLSFLSYLEIGNNSFHGEIPQELGRLTRLKCLSLQMNNLTGEIPASIGLLRRLELLDLSDNDLLGSVPLSIFNVSSLKVIDMNWNDLSGTLPSNICNNLPYLRLLSIGRNQLSGQLPSGFGRCKDLQLLALSYNQFTGSLPRDIWNSTTLQTLLLGWNNFTGNIPSEIENLSAVQSLSLRRSNLGGLLPPSIGNLSNLEMIDLGYNHLHGKIPQEFRYALKLKEIYLGTNMLSGEVPSSIFNISGLEMISFVANEISGRLILDHSLPNLKGLYLGINQFSGPIPSSIANFSKLIQLDLGRNMFNGNVPMNLGNLQQLQVLNLQVNQLTNDASTGELSFLTTLTNCKYLKRVQIGLNPISGTFPESLAHGNWSNSLENFLASDCNISGRILPEFGNFSNLVWLSIANNELIGSIPSELGNLKQLQKLGLERNKLDGIIPKSLCNMNILYEISLSNNKLSGEIPSCLANLSSLRQLFLDYNALTSNIPSTLWSNKDISTVSLSNNFLNGSLALEIGNSRSLLGLFLSGNLLSGQIPSTIGQLQNLVTLSLSMNRMHGPIPESFKDLASLEYLDLSGNNLSGMIPKSLENLEHLTYLNVSFNRLTGEIPKAGPFINFTAESFIGNTALCGESRYQVMACSVDNSPKRTTKKMALIISVLASVFVLAALLLSIFVIWLMKWRKSRQLPLNISYFQSHKRICYYEIVQGTNNFDEANLIGKGGLGLVYKGILADGLVIAIKVFNTEVQDAFIRFDLECRVLRNIRHRNLVKVISSVSSLDFKALVLEYMSNGNLDSWLYSHNNFLDLIQRIKVMIDVASAMEYLHEGQYSSVVVHCDLKPSNILLDGDMVARVSDFGISKLLTADNLIAHTKTLGTIGYMAPEYGSEGMVSTKGDVYSFGILLMETFTRKKPMDDLFVGDLTLKRWVLQSFPNRLVDVVDANLFSRHGENFTSKESCFQLIMELALNCTVDIPEERINMKDVLVRLKKILAQYLKDITTN